MPIDEKLVERLYRQAKGERWRLARERFAEALEASAERGLAGRSRDLRAVDTYLGALHLEDLAMACACAAGDDAAWEHFVREQRPLLYRAADALDPTGGARDLADSLYGELFGLRGADEVRRSLFRYFHGRSSLSTWLRAVLAQRHVDRYRSRQRAVPLPDDQSPAALAAPSQSIDPDRDRYLSLIRTAMANAMAGLAARDRLRLACYYAQRLTLAETGRVLGEHEATASRQLARSRRIIREAVEHELEHQAGLTGDEISACFESVTEDAGPLDVRDLLGGEADGPERKESRRDRSSPGTF